MNFDDTHDIAVGDYSNDGMPDIYEVNFTGAGSSNRLWTNTLTPATAHLPASLPAGVMFSG